MFFSSGSDSADVADCYSSGLIPHRCDDMCQSVDRSDSKGDGRDDQTAI